MKAMKQVVSRGRRFGFAVVPAVVMALVASSANAADWTAMTGTVDFSGEETAIIAIVGSLFGFYLVRKGGRLLLSMIK